MTDYEKAMLALTALQTNYLHCIAWHISKSDTDRKKITRWPKDTALALQSLDEQSEVRQFLTKLEPQ